MSNILKGMFTQEILKEGISEQDLADVLFARLEYRYPDIVKRYGMEIVGDAVSNVANFHAGADELGTSDISIMLRQILKQIENYALEEATGDTPMDPEYALQQARKITSQYKYADMHTDIIMQIQQLAEKSGIDPRELQYQIDEVYEKQRELESAIYALDEVFEDNLRNKEYADDVDEGQIYSTGGGAGQAMRWYRPKDNLGEGEEMSENLRKWFKEKWVRFGPDGKIRGACARGDDSEGKPKCLPQSKAHSLGKKGRASAAARKRREDPNPERRGKAINVNTKKKSNESLREFAPMGSGDNGDDGFDNNTLKMLAAQWWNGDEDPRVEKTLAAAGWEIGQDEGYDNGGVFVVRAGDVNGNSYMSWPAEELTELSEAFWKGYHKEGNKKMFGKTYPNCVKNTNEEQEQLDEKCWDTHKQVGMKSKGGKMVPNCVPKESVEEDQAPMFTPEMKCPHCHGELVSEELMNEKKDACYYKVKSRYKVWPSAYASGALVKCRKKGASNWGTGGKKNEGMVMGVSSDASSAGSKVQGESKKPKRESAIMKGLVDETKGLPYPGTYEQETENIKSHGARRITAMTNEEQVDEKWSQKYKRSIDCNNPKGFSQKAHCQGRKK